MGEEITHSHFTDDDYEQYYAHLKKETQELGQLFDEDKLSHLSHYCGLEQEAWILNADCYPVPENQFLLHALNNNLLSPELAKFNIELNVTPQILSSNGLSKMQAELETLWNKCDAALQTKQLHMEMIGILPTVRDEELIVANMSAMKRYKALNAQVLQSRNGRPLLLDIVGAEHLKSEHADVMLESAATSLQLHRQVNAKQSARYYNASIIISAITAAMSANAPYLFGKKLWEETRIPLFEQAVEVGGYGHAKNGPVRRVSFGTCYAKKSILECFTENLAHFPVLLPVKLDGSAKPFPYLRMHNGTIWRWNRPIIGFDDDGTTHLRIEHRVMAAGPTIIDEMANAAFFYGLQEYVATHHTAMEDILSFSVAKDNFYNAARYGLTSKIHWPDLAEKKTVKATIQSLIQSELLSFAEQGLFALGIDKVDVHLYLDVIDARVSSGQTGADWQKKYIEKRHIEKNNSGEDSRDKNKENIQFNMQQLTKAYRKNRLTGNPVHTWPI